MLTSSRDSESVRARGAKSVTVSRTLRCREKSLEPDLRPPVTVVTTSSSYGPLPNEDREPHPLYDVAARVDELFCAPLYRNPEHELMERWRELGERLLALGEDHLRDGLESGGVFVKEKLAESERRRERLAMQRAKRRVKRAAAAAAARAPAPAQPPEAAATDAAAAGA